MHAYVLRTFFRVSPSQSSSFLGGLYIVNKVRILLVMDEAAHMDLPISAAKEYCQIECFHLSRILCGSFESLFTIQMNIQYRYSIFHMNLLHYL